MIGWLCQGSSVGRAWGQQSEGYGISQTFSATAVYVAVNNSEQSLDTVLAETITYSGDKLGLVKIGLNCASLSCCHVYTAVR